MQQIATTCYRKFEVNCPIITDMKYVIIKYSFIIAN